MFGPHVFGQPMFGDGPPPGLYVDVPVVVAFDRPDILAMFGAITDVHAGFSTSPVVLARVDAMPTVIAVWEDD